MPLTPSPRPRCAKPDPHEWWTVRFTWPNPWSSGTPGFSYTMRPTRQAALNYAALVLARGRKRNMTWQRPLAAHLKDPHEDHWHTVPPPGGPADHSNRPNDGTPHSAHGHNVPHDPEGARTPEPRTPPRRRGQPRRATPPA